MTKLLTSLIWIISLQLIGLGLGRLTAVNLTWYDDLYKSALTPASSVFAVVWSLLYLLLALVGSFLWQSRHKLKVKPLWRLFLVQLGLNWAWTPLFFYLHLTGSALLLIIILWTTTCYLVIKAWQTYPTIAYCLVFYLVWLGWASYLNFIIWYFN